MHKDDFQAYRNLASEVIQLAVTDYFAVRELVGKYRSEVARRRWIEEEIERLRAQKCYPKKSWARCSQIAHEAFAANYRRAETALLELTGFLSSDSRWSVMLDLDMSLFWSKLQEMTAADYPVNVHFQLKHTAALAVY